MIEKIKKISRLLYPTGRAFYSKDVKERLNNALALSEQRLINDSLSVFDSILPDNNNFTAVDATDWENRLGIISSSSVNLADRKKAILRKMNHPADLVARQNYKFLESQLRMAGFDVYVYENRFSDGSGGFTTKSPFELNSGVGGVWVQMGFPPSQMGDISMGQIYANFVANYIDEELDSQFSVSGLRSTFFIGANPVGNMANVPLIRKDEFRQIILRLKPVQTIAYLFVNYT